MGGTPDDAGHMDPTKIKNLSHTPLSEIHPAFEDAFSNYDISVQMPVSQLEEMMMTRGFDPDLSVGFFSENRLAGFILVGYRTINREQVCYDIATGVIRSFQKKGIGEMLLQSLMKKMKSHKIDRFVLEVLTTNTPAQKLYLNNGFRITRQLNCFERSISDVLPSQTFEKTTGCDFLLKNNPDETLFNSFPPSWQNSLASYKNNPCNFRVRTLSLNDNTLIAYGIVHKQSGKILQIGIQASHRNLQTASDMIHKLSAATSAKKLVYLNVESGSEMETILEQLDFSQTVQQYEMEYRPWRCRRS